MQVMKTSLSISVLLFASFCCLFFLHSATAFDGANQQQGGGGGTVPVVKKDERWSLLSTEFGQISAVKISDGSLGSYYLQFITMQPYTLFLPVYLQTDMVFYVNAGNGTLSWVDIQDDDKTREVKLRQGDVYRLPPRSFFYLRTNLEAQQQEFQIYAIFADSYQELREGGSVGAYVSLHDMVVGFDSKVLQAALKVPEDVIEEIKRGGNQPLIVGGVPDAKDSLVEANFHMMGAFHRSMNNDIVNSEKAYSILREKHDFESCNGWSSIVTPKELKALKNSDFGVFMVNLAHGSMMGPHWNPMAVEIAVVLHGRGMVQVVCPSSTNETLCRNMRFRVEEGDVFVVPRYHPMVQMSFNDDSFIFMGFTTTSKENHPQYLAGKASVLKTLDRLVLATSFNVSKMTIDRLLKAQEKSNIILECTSCAEDEEITMEAEIEREREEEEEEEEEEEGGGGGGEEQQPEQAEGEGEGGHGGGGVRVLEEKLNI